MPHALLIITHIVCAKFEFKTHSKRHALISAKQNEGTKFEVVNFDIDGQVAQKLLSQKGKHRKFNTEL